MKYYIFSYIASSDNKVTDEEFQLILEELEKYKVLKEEVRTKTKKKILAKNEESLIERRRKEACESFRRLIQKRTFKEVGCPNHRCSFSCDISNNCD